jgi:hypothetical protein
MYLLSPMSGLLCTAGAIAGTRPSPVTQRTPQIKPVARSLPGVVISTIVKTAREGEGILLVNGMGVALCDHSPGRGRQALRTGRMRRAGYPICRAGWARLRSPQNRGSGVPALRPGPTRPGHRPAMVGHVEHSAVQNSLRARNRCALRHAAGGDPPPPGMTQTQVAARMGPARATPGATTCRISLPTLRPRRWRSASAEAPYGVMFWLMWKRLSGSYFRLT